MSHSVCQIINSGVDMMMISSSKRFQEYSEGIKRGVK
jgi:hypothetical protein